MEWKNTHWIREEKCVSSQISFRYKPGQSNQPILIDEPHLQISVCVFFSLSLYLLISNITLYTHIINSPDADTNDHEHARARARRDTEIHANALCWFCCCCCCSNFVYINVKYNIYMYTFSFSSFIWIKADQWISYAIRKNQKIK